jgi:hypothetical protein
MKIISIICITLFMFACGSKNGVEKGSDIVEMKKELSLIDDSLKQEFQEAKKNNRMVSGDKMARTISAYLKFYKAFPKDDYAPFCLDKIQGLHMQNNNIHLSLAYSDTLLANYPKYENRFVILESQGANYDVFEEYRDTNLVRKYYTLLLNEHKKITNEKRKDIQYRLDHLNLTFEELIMLRIKEGQ